MVLVPFEPTVNLNIGDVLFDANQLKFAGADRSLTIQLPHKHARTK